jgi:hypothetical protein
VSIEVRSLANGLKRQTQQTSRRDRNKEAASPRTYQAWRSFSQGNSQSETPHDILPTPRLKEYMCSAVKLFALIASPIDLSVDPGLRFERCFLCATALAGEGVSISPRRESLNEVGHPMYRRRDRFDDERATCWTLDGLQKR